MKPDEAKAGAFYVQTRPGPRFRWETHPTPFQTKAGAVADAYLNHKRVTEIPDSYGVRWRVVKAYVSVSYKEVTP